MSETATSRGSRRSVKQLVALIVGIYFGIVLVKSEVISWYRIQEMFHFHSFFMYGVLGTAIAVGALSVFIIRTLGIRSLTGESIDLKGKPFNRIGNIAGGIIFGFGWALTGACPGPLYALLGAGHLPFLVALASAMGGAIAYGYLRPKLPH